MGTCKTCGGTGLIPDPDQDEEDDITCPDCEGEGWIDDYEEEYYYDSIE